MHRARLIFTSISIAFLAACGSSPTKEAKIYAAGEKAGVGPLTYAVVDTQIFPQLGESRHGTHSGKSVYVVQLSVSNSSNADVPIPALTLVDDNGQTYNELSDGTDVPNWMGVIRKVGAGGTELGSIAFDAPSKHYRLRVTDVLHR